MYSIGQQLKQARKRLGINLGELEKKTKIEGAYLRALESDQYQLIANPVYVRAYIRAYAKEVGLPSQPLINQYESLINNGSGQMMNSQTTSIYQSKNLRHTMPTQPSRANLTPPVRKQVDVRTQKTMNMQALSSNSDSKRQTLDELYQSSTHLAQKFKPRKVAIMAKEGVELAKDQLVKQKRNKKVWVIVASILLIIGGVYYFMQEDTEEVPKEDLEVTANTVQKPITVLEQGEANDELGHMYYITNVSKLEVEFQGIEKVTKFRYGTSKDQYSEKVLQEGESFKMDTAQKNEVWFWLETPSNFKVTINGQILDTSAQDVQKSYRVQIKK